MQQDTTDKLGNFYIFNVYCERYCASITNFVQHINRGNVNELSMTTFENLTKAQRARVALCRDVKSICTETCHFLGLDVTKPAIEIVAELVYKKISVYGTDLEAFAKHAKRSTINDQDVRLLARRNPSLKSRLDALTPDSAKKEKRRKTVVPVIKLPETPTTKPAAQVERPSTSKTMDKEFEVPMDIEDNAIDLTFED